MYTEPSPAQPARQLKRKSLGAHIVDLIVSKS
jgi:hypothetical protein